jgi:peptidoglycan/LPS O-acetylase OafA/YrhL
MGQAFSIYLDLVRFTAACLVYLYHSNQRLLVQEGLVASDYGHSGVVVFFVLSGLVIAFITDTKERQWASYAASRIARIYSVALPAVLLTILLDTVGRQWYPALYALHPFDQFSLRSLASLLMLNELWFFSITTFSNGPYWSIGYEVWYYVAFGLWAFLPRHWGRWVLVGLAFLVGPKIVLMAPIWGLGVLLYHWRQLNHISVLQGWALVVVSTAGIVAFHQANLMWRSAALLKELVGAHWYPLYTYSRFFMGDYLLGALVFLHFAGIRRVSGQLAPVLFWAQRPIRYLAGYTLSLYLLHQPLFLFWAAVLRGDPNGYTYWAMTTALVAVSVWAIGWLTENKRHVLKHWLERQFLRVQAHFSPSHAAKI